MTTKTEKRPAEKRRRDPNATGVRMLINGKPQGATLSKLSNVAYFRTAGIGGKNVERISTKALLAELAKLGVADPYAAGWEVTLPNGVTLKAVTVTRAGVAKLAAGATNGKAKPAKKAAAKRAPKPKAATKRGAASTPVKAGRLVPRKQGR